MSRVLWWQQRCEHAAVAEQRKAERCGDKDSYWESWVAAKNDNAHNKKILRRLWKAPKEELYQLGDDPYEFNNLALAVEHQEVKVRLRKELVRWMGSQGDKGTDVGIPNFYTGL